MTTVPSDNGDRLMTVTARSRNAKALRHALRGQLGRFGISRVSDLTGMDVTGLPVYSAVRPRAATISVSAGKGFTADDAWVSAVMESIETAAAESFDPANKLRGSAVSLGAGYSLADLPASAYVSCGDSTITDWVSAESLGQMDGHIVPYLACGLRGYAQLSWMPSGFVTSSNGIAAGTSEASATAHALSELIERDALYRMINGAGIQRIMAKHSDFGLDAQTLLDTMRRLGFSHVSTLSPALGGMTVAVTYIHAGDMPQVFGGTACSHSAQDALTRSLMEAAQSRTSVISGLRDDIPVSAYSADVRPPLDLDRGLHDWSGAPATNLSADSTS